MAVEVGSAVAADVVVEGLYELLWSAGRRARW